MKLRLVLFGFVMLSAALVCLERTPLVAQAKKGNNNNDAQLRNQINQLEAKVKQLQAQLNNAKKDDRDDDTKIKQLQAQLNAAKKDDKGDDAKIKDLQKKLKDKDDQLQKLSSPTTAIVHSVIFKIKNGGDENQAKKSLDDAAKTLTKVQGVRGLYFGKPAAKGAASAETDYQFGMVVILDDSAALQRFLDAPAHKNLQKSFEKPTVYDFQK